MKYVITTHKCRSSKRITRQALGVSLLIVSQHVIVAKNVF